MSTICPLCGQEHDAASMAQSNERQTPRDGDASFCFSCGTVNIFEDRASGGLRRPTKREQRLFDKDERLQEILAAWREVKNYVRH